MRIVTHAAAAAMAIALVCALRSSALASMPADGARAPAIPVLQSVFDGTYGPFDLAKASAGRTVVLYFFPKAFTEG
jgi:hypothetical protein